MIKPEKKNIPRRKKNPNAVNYIDNKKFLEEIKIHKKKLADARAAGLPDPKLNHYLGDCIMKIGNNLANLPKFYGYSFIDEMVLDGIENCILYFDRFDETKYDNPFAYYTQIMKWAFIRRINKEEKDRYIIYKNFESSMINNGSVDMLLDENDNLISMPMYDNILEAIDKFEKKEAEKKKKRLETKDNLAKIIDKEG